MTTGKALQAGGFIIAAIIIIGAIVLTALNKDVPAELWGFGGIALGIGGGATIPAHATTED